MAFTSGHRARCFFAGLDLAAYTNTMNAQASSDMHDVTVFTDGAKTFIVGQDSGTFGAAGPYDVDGGSAQANKTAKTLNAASVQSVVSYFPSGTDAGGAVLVEGNVAQFDVSSPAAGPVEWTLEMQNTGPHDFNGQLFDTATVTTDTNGSSKDDGAATSNGAVFHLHVTAFTGLTSDAITVEGSTTGAFSGEETTVATFSTVDTSLMLFSGASDRQEVTGTIPRYLRVVDDVTGTGSITRTVTYARR